MQTAAPPPKNPAPQNTLPTQDPAPAHRPTATEPWWGVRGGVIAASLGLTLLQNTPSKHTSHFHTSIAQISRDSTGSAHKPSGGFRTGNGSPCFFFFSPRKTHLVQRSLIIITLQKVTPASLTVESHLILIPSSLPGTAEGN